MNSNAESVRIMFAGGGTGGHLFPALAIADRLKELLSPSRNVEIQFVGTRRGLEYRMREKLGYSLHLINVRGLARSLSPKNLLVPFILISALLRSAALLNKFQPDLVVGTGGYVAWPVLKMANWKSIPTVLQEQNSFPGVTTRQLAGKARRVYLGFGQAQEHIKTEGKLIVTGNPVRTTSDAIDRNKAMKEFGLDPARKTILILGGSQGARTINRAVLKSLAAKPLALRHIGPEFVEVSCQAVCLETELTLQPPRGCHRAQWQGPENQIGNTRYGFPTGGPGCCLSMGQWPHGKCGSACGEACQEFATFYG